jgi:hypothetical protein
MACPHEDRRCAYHAAGMIATEMEIWLLIYLRPRIELACFAGHHDNKNSFTFLPYTDFHSFGCVLIVTCTGSTNIINKTTS